MEELNWPFVYHLSSGYAARMPTLEGAINSMIHEMKAGKETLGIVYKESNGDYWQDKDTFVKHTNRKAVATFTMDWSQEIKK